MHYNIAVMLVSYEHVASLYHLCALKFFLKSFCYTKTVQVDNL